MFLQNLRQFLIALLFLPVLSGCVSHYNEFSKIDGLSETEKTFLQLYFTRIDSRYGPKADSKLIYKKNLTLYVLGNDADSFMNEVRDVIQLMKPAFAIRLTKDRENADIVMHIYRSEASKGINGAFADQINFMNSYPIKHYGKYFGFSPNGEAVGPRDGARRYNSNNFTKVTFSPCITAFFYRDFSEQVSIFGARGYALPITRYPDQSLISIHSGFYGKDKAKAYANLPAKESNISKLARICILEEIAHAATLWSDIPRKGDNRFMERNKNFKGDLDAYLATRKNDKAEARSLFSLYTIPGVHDGMTKQELIGVFSKN